MPGQRNHRFVQTIGRGLRPSPGKDHLIVLDHAGNHRRLGLVTDIGCRELDNGDAGRSYDRDGRVAVPTIKLCPECNCVLPPRARECPACGFVIAAVTHVTERDGELEELGQLPSPRAADESIDEKRFIAMLKGYASERGYDKPDGFAWHKFKERFGREPLVYIKYVEQIPPDLKTRNWIKSRLIAYAKARH
jgi:DNA repair protein RadD